MPQTFPLLSEFTAFTTERWRMHQRRTAGKLAPWTTDPILQTYRFCNVRREDDRVTRWLHANWLYPHAKDANIFFAIYVARVFNLPSTLQAVGPPLPFNAAWIKHLRAYAATAPKLYNGAYIVSTNGRAMNKLDYYLDRFAALWAARATAAPRKSDTCQSFFERLTQFEGIGTFMGAQVVADLKWIAPLKQATDWSIFAASGPGSRRGLNRVCGRAVDAPWVEATWHATLLELRKAVLPKLPKELRDLDMQNLQNGMLCEGDKYFRVKNGEGRPKQNFAPSKDNYPCT